MRCLHIAALPYPSPQGTQGLLHSMLGALADAGHDTHLACYAHGAHGPFTPRYRLHRLPLRLGLRSLRSGPGLRKLALDGVLALQLRALVRQLAPDRIVAHHAEAALACIAAGLSFEYVAHTSLGSELPSYFAPAFAQLLAGSGAPLDRALCRAARRVWAVSPALAALLSAEAQRPVQSLAIPWPLAGPISEAERHAARAALGFAPGEQVLLYAGNLDAYQGLAGLAESVRRLARDGGWRWLIATASDPATCMALRDRTLPLRFAPLAREHDRRLAHAAADVVCVPRAAPGGVPIKLLDALARGTRVVTTQRASGGFPIERVCEVVGDDDSPAFADACRAALARDPARAAQGARDYIARAHSAAGFAAQFAREA